MSNFTQTDERNLLAKPGFFYYRDYGSTGAWQKSVFMNGSQYQVNTETAEIAFDDVGTVRDEVSDETVEISMSAGQVLDLNLISKLTGGLYEYSTVAGTLVSGATQTIASGAWGFERTILIENQNGDGTKPTITSLVSSVDGALVSGTDFYVSKLDGAGWALVVLDTATVTTEVQDLVLTYSYTPAARTILKRGGVKIISPVQVAFQTIVPNQLTGEDEYVTFYFYKVFSNGNIGHGFSPENEAAPITIDLTLTCKKDTNRTVGDQLYSVVRGDSVLA